MLRSESELSRCALEGSAADGADGKCIHRMARGCEEGLYIVSIVCADELT